jgi:hypothetical protein
MVEVFWSGVWMSLDVLFGPRHTIWVMGVDTTNLPTGPTTAHRPKTGRCLGVMSVRDYEACTGIRSMCFHNDRLWTCVMYPHHGVMIPQVGASWRVPCCVLSDAHGHGRDSSGCRGRDGQGRHIYISHQNLRSANVSSNDGVMMMQVGASWCVRVCCPTPTATGGTPTGAGTDKDGIYTSVMMPVIHQ